MLTPKILEVKKTHMIKLGVDVTISELKEIDIILWNWEGVYGLIPQPIIENAKNYIKEHFPMTWDNGKECRAMQLIAPNKTRPKPLNFVWAQVREIEPYVAKTLKGL